jgi:plasmid replication initiation protein
MPVETGTSEASAALKQSGRTPPTSSFRDPDKQLRAGVELITEAFELKAQQQQSEVSHWKQVASQQKQQVINN